MLAETKKQPPQLTDNEAKTWKVFGDDFPIKREDIVIVTKPTKPIVPDFHMPHALDSEDNPAKQVFHSFEHNGEVYILSNRMDTTKMVSMKSLPKVGVKKHF